MRQHPIGIYEKAMPKSLSFAERFKMVKAGGFDFMEISVDETDERLSRLDWTKEQRLDFVKLKSDLDVRVPSMCLSGHRKYPFGSHDASVRDRAMEIMVKAIDFACDTGVRTIQLAGYDVYYEDQDEGTKERFIEGTRKAVEYAAACQVMLATEIMDTPFLNSITKWKEYDDLIKSPWFGVYPDVGNLTGWNNDVPHELEVGIDKIAAIHLKETLPVSDTCKGQFRDLYFGQGTVDFLTIFKKLKALNYRGAFLLEMWGENDPQALDKIIAAREFIEKKMAEADFK
ncbi:L-ribulose-5-phosphate 3-epimerase ulaE [Anaerobiospirillum thomasii]|uniref:L-ribulose-5-phosphate 3-epimerase n=2 Tax=Gammaproteobacteria TaxID=1236 RepID=A0A2X0WWL8_9GAMM|nr:L-ribulose-5-phosphate 3-epimerase [Anaerobiospirillum thomasii]SPT69911.1 L-ribulose-5-phosphate 3-epimerase ulaE [Anaerobiospirillum thomasii]SPT71430.1 L-ribulose-5-phosphate 3-epimerase ulaE [Anaerobiospirillum thomasii]SPT78925.1 L-ribulose-5-phosphate 3-epimerase ulaE [Anaerobiospirillum thomasii]